MLATDPLQVFALTFGQKPLKLRAYNKSKGMIEGGSLEIWFSTCAATGTNPIVNRRLAGEALVFMQYIAKDKDGKDMYEGDIVEIDHHTQLGVIKLRGIMEWNPDRLAFGTSILTKLASMSGDIVERVEKPRVIGNIFTTPDLLKEFVTLTEKK